MKKLRRTKSKKLQEKRKRIRKIRFRLGKYLQMMINANQISEEGLFKNIWESYYEEKLQAKKRLSETDYEAMLETLQEDEFLGLDALGWDVVY